MKAGRKPWSFGPGFLVTAAFIGPGTITTASVAGARFGYALLWALAFSIVATLILQEMSARLGLVSRAGLGEALRTSFSNRFARIICILLVIAAITVGNAAFQAGNLIGAAIGAYKWIERVLIALVGLMSVVFLVTMIIVRPDLGFLLEGIFIPVIPDGSLLTILALVGTTVVPYNLFLHANAVGQKWPKELSVTQALKASRVDTFFSIVLGGLITMAVIVTAATFFERGSMIESATMMAEQLEPLLGPAAKYFFALGLVAAGLTSAVTAPLAAAYATAGAMGWSLDLKDRRFRAVWSAIILIGMVLALAGGSPVAIIIFAQATNGLLLPLVAVFLLIAMNRKDLLGRYRNGAAANLLGGAVVIVAAGLGVCKLLQVAGLLD